MRDIVNVGMTENRSDATERNATTELNSRARENLLRGIKNRVLQLLARVAPGRNVRVFLHRARGVKIGKGVWIGYDVILETSRPDLITIDDGAAISVRATVIANFKEQKGVRIGKDVFVGPGAIVLPRVGIGDGSVIKAGSVVSLSIPPGTIAEGNPAIPVGRCEIPLRQDISLREFVKGMKPLSSKVEKPK